MKKYILLIGALLFCSNAWAYRAIIGGEFGSESPIVFSPWNNATSAEYTTELCGQASSLAPPYPKPWWVWNIRVDYTLRLTNASNTNDGFALRNGNTLLPFSVSYIHIPNNNTQNLQHNQKSNNNSNDVDCDPGFMSSRLFFSIAESEITQVPSGIYQNRFLLKLGTTYGEGGDDGEKEVNLSITVEDVIKLSNINDFIFGANSGDVDISQTNSLCVFRNSNGAYQITATGNGAGGSFTVSNGPYSIPFTPQWSDGNGFQTLTPNTPITNQQNVFRDNVDCNGGAANNANLKIGISSTAMQAVPAGNYQGIINLMVSAQ